MENRRPPRSNSSGRKPYFDRSRDAPSFRAGRPSGPGTGKQPRRVNRTGDGRNQDGAGHVSDPNRRDGRSAGEFRRSDGKRPGFDRFDSRRGDGKGRGPNNRLQKPEIEI